VAAVAAVALLAGCQQSPEARIKAACMKGGLNSQPGQTQPAQQNAAETKRFCDCFTSNVKGSMTPAELKQLADAMNAPKKEGEDNIPPALQPKMLGAIKACAIPS